jgi:hypothetical protein
MIFNGHTLETISELDDVTMANIQTMYADGMIGNYGVLTQLATLTNGVFNYMRTANSSPYKLVNILGSAYDYIYPPLSDDEVKANANNSLLAFMTQAQGFDAKLFEVGKNG